MSKLRIKSILGEARAQVESALASRNEGAYADSKLSPRDVVAVLKILTPVLNKHARRWEPVGSFRRGKQQIGDVDIILSRYVSYKPMLQDIAPLFDGGIISIGREGQSLCSFVVHFENRPIQIEFSNVDPDNWGAALMHGIGSGKFNMGIRGYCKEKGLSLTQYGLKERVSGKIVAGATEEEIFDYIGFKYIPHKERTQSFFYIKDKYRKIPK